MTRRTLADLRAGAWLVFGLAWSLGASAQAWLPPKGEATMSFGFAHSFADSHLDYRGANVSPGDMVWNNAVADLSYGITDRLAVRANVPYVVSRYLGSRPHPPLPTRPTYDDGRWHGTFQDFRLEARFKAIRGPLVVTPMAAFGTPTHFYEYYGHAAAGRKLTEGQVGLNLGALIPDETGYPAGYVQTRYVFSVPQKVAGISNNRSNLFVDVGYFVTPSLTVSMLGAWQKSYGGWRAGIDWPATTSPLYEGHDQLGRVDFLRFGGGASYALTGSIDLGLNAFTTIHGTSDVNMASFTFSVSYSFSPAQVVKKKKGPRPID